MAMKRCPECGENYSDTYKYCPFCEEEEALQQGGQIRRSSGRGGKRVAGKGRQPNLLSPILIVLILLMACLLVYLLFGDKIAEKLRGDGEPVTPPADTVEPVAPGIGDGEDEPDPDGAMPEDPNASGGDATGSGSGSGGETTYEQAAALPAGLTLSSTDFSLFKVGESSTLSVSGGNGTYSWYSEDEGVASVDANGKVTAISRGDIKVVVTDGTKQGTCIVRVKVSASSGGTTPAVSTPSGGENKLSLTDFTLKIGEPDVQLSVSGITTGITWSSKDPGIATVSGSGKVKAVGKGTTTVFASWDGQSLECIVRVPGSV